MGPGLAAMPRTVLACSRQEQAAQGLFQHETHPAAHHDWTSTERREESSPSTSPQGADPRRAPRADHMILHVQRGAGEAVASPVCEQGAELHYPSCLYRKPLG